MLILRFFNILKLVLPEGSKNTVRTEISVPQHSPMSIGEEYGGYIEWQKKVQESLMQSKEWRWS